MDVEFTVSLSELKRAFRRLSARLLDESEAGSEFVIFNATDNDLRIVASRTSEGLSASVAHPGRASVPFPIFCGIARILRFYRQKTVRFAFSGGVLKIDRTAIRHPSISVLPGTGRLAARPNVITELGSCSARNPRPSTTSTVPFLDFSLTSVPQDTEEEQILSEYKRHYEGFRDVGQLNAAVSAQDEATLLHDYYDAQRAWEQWLSFVADTIEQESALEAGGTPFEYSQRSQTLLAAIKKLDQDSSEVLHVRMPAELVSVVGEQPDQLGHRLVTRFSHLTPDAAQTAARELDEKYKWRRLF